MITVVLSMEEEQQIKELFKQAILELLEERQELFQEMFAELIEEAGLMNAIREGEQTPNVSREEIFQILEESA